MLQCLVEKNISVGELEKTLGVAAPTATASDLETRGKEVENRLICHRGFLRSGTTDEAR
jgi:hypothetical protein